jgi:hypothetical protein
MHDNEAEVQLLQIMLVLESLIDGDENVELILDERQQNMIFEPVPPKLKSGSYLVTGEKLGHAWIDACV